MILSPPKISSGAFFQRFTPRHSQAGDARASDSASGFFCGLIGIFLLTNFFASEASAQLQPARIISNGMVIQREVEVPLWGTASAGATVTVTFNSTAYTAQADTAGRWRVVLPAMGAGGAFGMTIASNAQQITLSTIYVGDVWLASGQSNIEFTLNNAEGGAAAIAAANDQMLRQFKVPKGLANEPSDDLPAGSAWTPATSQYAGNFSAIGYFFGRELRQEIGVPIGILNTSYGGSRIETWMSEEMLGYDETDVVLANGEPERQPTLAYNKMLHPLLQFPIKGVIWYQGESNADKMGDALAYGDLFKTMITSWRALWGLGDFPFLWVQLPNYGTPLAQPQTWDAWPRLRENQSAALSLPNTGEAITIDVGGTDIHPTKKEPVGHRLALVARKVAYGEDIVFSGPRYRSNTLREDGRVVINYNHIGGGLVAQGLADSAVNGFAIAGDNGSLVWADAVIAGDQVVVWNDAVPEPVIVRYAWEYNPDTANLYNVEGLPAAPFLANVNPGFKIASFRAGRTAIEQGQSTTLSWVVYGASSVMLDGVAVDSAATITVSPAATTTYALVAVNRIDANETDTARVTIEVLDPNLISRALHRPTEASTFESCCGGNLIAGLAVDGDLATRWSSAWQVTNPGDPNTDEDPDDEWISVDFGEAVDLERVILYWEAAHGSSYDLELSYDGYLWRTVYEERLGNGGEDNIAFSTPPSGRFLRMHGIQRATQWGYSLWEIAGYGTVSTKFPPAVRVNTIMGNVFRPGTNVTLIANASDADGSVQQATFYVNGELLSTDNVAPFEASWTPSAVGEYGVTAIVADSDGLTVQSDSFKVFIVNDNALTRFEAENAAFTGQGRVIRSTGTSNGAFLEMRDAWTLTFNNVNMPAAGEYLLSIGYQLTFESPKTQYLVINGDTLTAVEFTAPNTAAWLQRGLKVPLQAGANQIALHGFWNWMSFDFIAVESATPVSVGELAEPPLSLWLSQNYPNPFNPTTMITYTLPQPGYARLEIYDLTGKTVATPVDGRRPTGTHMIEYDASGLASGVYFYKLKFNAEILTRSMVLVR